ncbi:MAG: hypothetical protein J6V28_04935 [Tidjanibacter sp.]|nr:hypothetical protein [Tidjanibacter sp.]MBQ2247612.1 hypothetical protein [Tidjanibacter sp.]
MKRLIVVVAAALAMVGCATDSPEKVVEKCWKYLSEGEYADAVALMDAAPEERELYEAIFAEQCGELQRAGGMEEFELKGRSVGETDATVDGVVILKDGQRVELSCKLVLREGGWLITE